MNRQIEFRGQDCYGKWHYGLLQQMWSPLSESFDPNRTQIISSNNGKPYNIGIETVCQYVGFNDINEKKVYEGDIIKATLPVIHNGVFVKPNIITMVISFEIDCFAAFIARDIKNKSQFRTMHDFIINFATAEVLGNVFDNPELLTDKTDKK